MFVRLKRSLQNGILYEYLQIAQSYRKDGKPRQRVLATLGRRDEILTDGSYDALLESMAKFSEKYRALALGREMAARSAKSWGPALVFGRLWEEQGLSEIVRNLAGERKFGFDVERVAFALALQRHCAPGSDLQGSEWVETVEGLSGIALQHLYRTNGFLAEVRAELERALFLRDRDLFFPGDGPGFFGHNQRLCLSGHGDRMAQARLLARPSAGLAAGGLGSGGGPARMAGVVGRVPRPHGGPGGAGGDDRQDAGAVLDPAGHRRGRPGDDGEEQPEAFDGGTTDV
jgi:hypothetical protein